MIKRALALVLSAWLVCDASLAATTLLDWVEELGGELGPWEARVDVNVPGRGLFATEEVPKKTVLGTIPMGAVFSAFNMFDSSIVGVLDGLDLDEATTMIVYLICERSFGADSKWYPYLRTLPRIVDVPLFYTAEEVEELQDTLVRRDIQRMQEETEATYRWFDTEVAQHERATFPAEHYTLKNWKWATAIISTRAHQIPQRGEDAAPVMVLIPIADMMNAYNGIARSANVVYDVEEDSIIATRDIWKGDELVVEYPHGRCSQFLQNYGFCPDADKAEPTPEDLANVGFAFSSVHIPLAGDAILDATTRVYTGLELSTHAISTIDCVPNSLEAAVRLDLMNVEELSNLTQFLRDEVHPKWPSYHIRQASVDDGNPDGEAAMAQREMHETVVAVGTHLLNSEVEALPNEETLHRAIADTIQRHLDFLPTTVEEDVDILATLTITSRKGQIVSVRLREKRVLRHCIDTLLDGIEVEVQPSLSETSDTDSAAEAQL